MITRTFIMSAGCGLRCLVAGALLAVSHAGAEEAALVSSVQGERAMKTQFLRLPVEIGGKPHALQAMIMRPPGVKKAPLALLMHGSPRDAASRRSKQLMYYHDQAVEFVQRGYCTVVFMRRGYGTSDGEWSESYRRGKDYDFVRAGRATAADARAVISGMSEFEFVDRDTVIVIGQSAGGFGAVALAADPPENLKAVLNFAGGRGSTRNNHVAGGDRLPEAFGVFGGSTKVPSLWVYTRNDKFFGPEMSKEFHRRFTRSGGQTEFHLLPDFGQDGHGLFSSRSGIGEWRPLVSAFLKRHGLPTWQEEPVLPSSDVQEVPAGLNQKGREQWALYLDRAPNKAWAYNRKTGAWGYRTRQDSMEGAVAGALKAAGEGAVIISQNGRSVGGKP